MMISFGITDQIINTLKEKFLTLEIDNEIIIQAKDLILRASLIY